MFHLNTRMNWLGLALLALWMPVQAQTVFTQNTTISATNTQYEGQDIVVSGATLTIDGAHQFQSLSLESGAVLTHSVEAPDRPVLTVAGLVSVASGSSIDLGGRGNKAAIDTAHAGGSYGGRGGVYGGTTTNAEYGDYLAPVDYGTSRNDDTRGGGAIKLTAGSLQLDGVIRADGQSGGNGYGYAGGGSGGSIWLEVGTLSGSGSIHANGGAGRTIYSYHNGGGGGGRIAVYFDENTGFDPANILAAGGAGRHDGQYGGAGTVYVEHRTQNTRILKFQSTQRNSARTHFSGTLADNAELRVTQGSVQLNSFELAGSNVTLNVTAGELRIMPSPSTSERWGWQDANLMSGDLTLNGAHQFTNLTATNSSIIRHTVEAPEKLDIDVLGSFILDESSSVDLGGRGNKAAIDTAYAGGSYGGRGGVYRGTTTNAEYGDYLAPVDYGTSRNDDTRGGGAIKLTAGSLQLDGVIRADGQSGGNGYGFAGGGSGGSIWLEVGTLSGSGSIHANGGAGRTIYSRGNSGGGGGRIAVYFDENTGFDPENVLAAGGAGRYSGQHGGAGTVYVEHRTQNTRILRFENSQRNGAWTQFNGNLDNSVELVVSQSRVTLNRAEGLEGLTWRDANLTDSDVGFYGAHEFASLSMTNNTVLVQKTAAERLDIVVLGAVLIDDTSRIDLNGRGKKATSNTSYAGGSYGGRGGIYGSSTTNAVYGDYLAPADYGTSRNTYTRGGGAIKLTASSLQLNGVINADGQTGGSGYSYAGGGSGGSIWLDVGTLSGSGSIHADGGAGRNIGSNPNSGGGGGRIAIYAHTVTGFDLNRVYVNGGAGQYSGQPGSPGTIHIDALHITTAVTSVDLQAHISDPISAFTINFLTNLDSASFDINDIDLKLNGEPIQAASITALSGHQYQVNYSQPLPEGNYQLRIGPYISSATGGGMDQDGDGATGEPDDDVFQFAFTIDNTAPNPPTVNLPLAPEVNLEATPALTLRGSRDPDTAIFIDNVVQVPLGSGDWSVDLTLAEGVNPLSIYAEDQAGNRSDLVEVIVEVDSVAPTVESLSPTGAVREAPAIIVAKIVEAGSGLDMSASLISVERDGIAVAGATAQSDNQLTFTPGTPLIGGNYSVSVTVVDKAGNTRVQSFGFTVDYTPPADLVLNPYPSVVTTNLITLGGGKEAGSSILLDGAELIPPNDDIQWSHEFTLNEGENTFDFSSRDAAGNTSGITRATVTYDNTAPGPVTFTATAEGDGETVILDWSGYDEVANGNDIERYRVLAGSSDFTSTTAPGVTVLASTASGEKSYTATGLPRGQITYFAVMAEDQQGQALTTVTALAVQPQDVVPPEEIGTLSAISGADQIQLQWGASANSAEDLAGYRVYVGNGVENGSPSVHEILLADLADPTAPVSYTVTGLQAASSYPVRVTAYDQDGNETEGRTDAGATLLPNPAGLSGEAFSGRVELQWAPATPFELVDHYAIYAQTNDFTDVSGMTPAVTANRGGAGAAEVSRALAGLANDTTYYIAVTTVNISGGQSPVVSTISLTPEEDTTGPVIDAVSYADAQQTTDLRVNPAIVRSGTLTVSASDVSEMSRVEFRLDGNLLAAALPEGNSKFTTGLDLGTIADGGHALEISAFDSLDNVTTETLTIDVNLAPPNAPQLTKPSDGSLTNQESLDVQGTAALGSQVQLYINGLEQGDPVLVNSQSAFSITATLTDGENVITAAAAYPDRGGLGQQSVARTVTLDRSIPSAPTGFSATSGEQGQVFLQWNPVEPAQNQSPIEGYRVYRATGLFDTITDPSVTEATSSLLSTTKYTDLILADGDYLYRVAAVNQAGTVGELSALQEASADSQGPRALTVRYEPQGNVDLESGAMAPGLVAVTVEFSEPLRNKPYFAIVPDGGLPITVDLSKDYNLDTRYTGNFSIEPGTLSGTAYAVLAAYDAANNRGTEIDQGATLQIDTDGPDLSSLALNPGEPLKVDSNTGVLVEVFARLSDEVKAGQSPVLVPLVDGTPVPGYLDGIVLARDAQSTPGNPLWVGSFLLPNTAGTNEQGEPAVATLSFSYEAYDELDNPARPVNDQFQLYQGDLPPLAVPLGLTAQAGSDGLVELEWRFVNEAAGYQLYRQAPGESELTEYARVSELTFTDHTTTDGTYFYTVASVREENGQTAFSAQSEMVSVGADRVAPAAPANLDLELNGAGIVARWDQPTLDAEGKAQDLNGLTYNLYRAPLPEGQQATDLVGYTPIQTDIPEPLALDTQPSESEHSYFVTAVDEAGNESLPSATVYLNFGLLPVQQLTVTLGENDLPELTWRHSGVGISGFNIYRGADDDLILINASPLPYTGGTTHFTDETYNAGEPSDGASNDRRYTVVARDENGIESLGHTLTLPALSVALNSAKGVANGDPNKLLRGVMNELLFRVENKGQTSQSGLRLTATVNVQGEQRQHDSEVFSVDAGSFATVPVVIGGYAGLDGVADLQLRLARQPLPGDSITIRQSDTVSVGDNALLATLTTDAFTRGGSGAATFTLENTSAVETEIVMASNNGNQPSPDVRLVLEDLDGNVLTVQPVQQFTGGVVNIGSGASVARIPSGGTFTSEPINLSVPLAAPDQVRVKLEIDQFHYHLGKPTHVAIEGTGSRRDVSLTDTPYYGTVTSISPHNVYGEGQDITISGQALERVSETPLANVPLQLFITVRGFERAFSVLTDGQGNFSFVYSPENESGTYTVSVVHPEMVARPNHGEFTIQSGKVSPSEVSVNIPRNYTQRIQIRVNAGNATTLEQVRLLPRPAPGETEVTQTVGLTAVHETLARINPGSAGYLNLNLTGDNTAPASGALYYRVEANGFSDDNALGDVVVRYQLSEAKPALSASPNYIETGVGLDGAITESVRLTNKGLETLINPRLTLTQADGGAAPSWASLITASDLPDLPVGQAADVQVRLAPTASVAEGNYHFLVTLQGDNLGPFTVPVFAAVTQSGRGNVFFHVSDIYTATLDDDNQLIPGLGGARIKLQNELVLTETFELTTDANGEATFIDLPAGRYTYRASAFDHASVTGRVFVKPGITGAEEVFLVNKLVTVEWQVNEITIEDRYEIELEATFETDVPIAVVMLDPLNVQLPVMRKGDVFYGELTLTNHGLIRADNVRATLPAGNELARFEFLKEIPETLESGEVLTLPYRVQALADFNPDADGSATGGACGSFNEQMKVDYQSECANGTTVPGGTSTNWNSNWDSNSCGGNGAGGGTSGGTGSYYYGGSGAGGSGGTTYAPEGSSMWIEESVSCSVEYCDDCNSDNGAGQ